MYIDDMPGCCKAKVLFGFGGGEFGEDDEENEDTDRGEEAGDEESITQEILAMQKHGFPSLLFASTTSNQPFTEAVLRKLGFTTTDKPAKLRRGRSVYGWVLNVNEFVPPAG